MRLRVAALLCAVALPAAAARDPGVAGRLAVGVTTLAVVDTGRDRTLVTELWYPARTAGRDAPMRRGQRPLAIVVHGHCGSRTGVEPGPGFRLHP